jgi:vancomycin resistance protein YoaR
VTCDYDSATETVTSGLSRWQGASTDLNAIMRQPEVSATAIDEMKDRVLKVLLRGDVSLAYDDQLWTLPAKELPDALTIRLHADGPVVTLKPETLEPLLDQAVKDLETEAKPTHFKVNDEGRIEDFEGGAIGKRVDREASIERINAQFESSKIGVFPLAVTTNSSPDSDPVAEELGIRELLGFGTSNFTGSPANRRKNIANGARLLNGLVIKPGETLGLLDHLRPFDAKNGYFPELVIKEKRTVPEYGGGLCQIGTTTFRATMGAGLPVVMRQNHSYRVRYYEPAGTDATLYDPAPDYKFLNDTADHVVLIAKQVGDNSLRFELWGTRDGRVQAQSKIRMWNITSPPPPKLTETSELAEGVKKCYEIAHAGATTNFTYTITYPDGTTSAVSTSLGRNSA